MNFEQQVDLFKDPKSKDVEEETSKADTDIWGGESVLSHSQAFNLCENNIEEKILDGHIFGFDQFNKAENQEEASEVFTRLLKIQTNDYMENGHEYDEAHEMAKEAISELYDLVKDLKLRSLNE